MPRIIVRPARAADFERLLAEPLPHRVRAFAGECDGELLGIGGLAFRPDNTVAAFLILARDQYGNAPARRYKIALHKAGLRVIEEARRLRIARVVALAEKDNRAAEPWLRRLGFHRLAGGAESVFIWTNEDDKQDAIHAPQSPAAGAPVAQRRHPADGTERGRDRG